MYIQISNVCFRIHLYLYLLRDFAFGLLSTDEYEFKKKASENN